MTYNSNEMLTELMNAYDCTPGYAERAVTNWFTEKTGSTRGTIDGNLEEDCQTLYTAEKYWVIL